MTLRDIAHFRTASQLLHDSTTKAPEDIVAYFGAVQAQEYALSKWTIGLRNPELKDADVEEAMTSGKILRLHLFRPTWHFIAAKDIHWMLDLSAPRVHQANKFMYKQTGLDDKILRKAHAVFESVLPGKQLTRDELNEHLKRKKIVAEGHRLSYIMMHAELEGVVTSGARRGNQFTYGLLEERAPKGQKMSKDEALAEITQRYFQSRGPATVNDFATWSGLTLADCKRGIDIRFKDLASEDVSDARYFWMKNFEPPKRRKKQFFLLPIYDEYIMGYKDRSAIGLRMPKGASTLFHSTMIYDGQIIGTWKRTQGKKIEMEYAFFEEPATPERTAFEKMVKNYERFTGLPVQRTHV